MELSENILQFLWNLTMTIGTRIYQIMNYFKSLMFDPFVKEKYKVLRVPTKSPNDNKEYKVIRLENGLRVCLISDVIKPRDAIKKDMNQEKLVATALCIDVGSYSNPKDIPGLAHFLEHMIFMGSEKYPEEDDFDALIKVHGGSDNISTDCEITKFYFECFEDYLYEAMDKFAQFFISPLMKKDSMISERKAIESEFRMTVTDDARKHQLLVSLAKESSPINCFSCGNMVSLKGNISDDQLYLRLYEFRKRHYSAHRMTLAVQATLPMDILEWYVISCFSSVPNNELPPKDFQQDVKDIFDNRKFNRMYFVKPATNICEVNLTWVLPSLLHLYESKPGMYISELLGHKGKGSLYSYLKRKVWILTLDTGINISNSVYATFNINIILTERGLINLDEVIGAIFSYLHMLKDLGPNNRFFKELKHIAEISFRFEEDKFAAENVEDLVKNMHCYPSKDYLTGSSLYFIYNPKAIEMILSHLVPDKMNIMLLSSYYPFTITYDKTEQWYGTQYNDVDIPSEWLKNWQTAELLHDLAFPQPNRFLTKDFSILPVEDNLPEYPEKVLDTPEVELWYKKDQTFKLPMAYYYYNLITPLSIESARSASMLQIFITLVTMSLSEEVYLAITAGLSFDILPCETGIFLSVSGYNEKLPMLVNIVVKHLKSVSSNFTVEMFQVIKEKLINGYHNAILKPHKLCQNLFMYVATNKTFSIVDGQAATSEVTFEMMKKFSNCVLKYLHIQGLVQGNVRRDVALRTTKKLVAELNCSPIIPELYPKITANEIPNGEHCCRVMSFNKDDTISVIFNYYQCGPLSFKENVLLKLILVLIDEPLFDVLRTKEQLSYSVECAFEHTWDVMGYSILVNAQADKHTAEHVDNRIEAFLGRSQKILNQLTDEQFNEMKWGLIKMKHIDDIALEMEVVRNWMEIVHRKYMYDRYLREIQILKKITIEEIRKWWEEHNSAFKKLSVQVVGHNAMKRSSVEEPYENLLWNVVEDKDEVLRRNKNEDYFITDIDKFKKKLRTYSTFK